MATQYYVDPTIAANSGTGTIGDPFGDLQYALDTVGAGVGRNATDGDQFNIKAGTAEILAASLTLATYGTPAAAAPLILRGYTAAANDGGIGEIDCGGFTMWAAKTYDYIIMVDLELHTFGNNDGIKVNIGIQLLRCNVHKGASAPNGKTMISLVSSCALMGCYIHDPGTLGVNVSIGNTSLIVGNYLVGDANSNTIFNVVGYQCRTLHNVVLCKAAGSRGIAASDDGLVAGNIVYNTAAGTSNGIYFASSGMKNQIFNNIICGFSGVGGDAIEIANVGYVGYNAFWNNTANYNITDQAFVDERANDVALGADPFTNAAAGDFSLTAAAKAALAGKGFPVDYYGAHANTVSNLNIGPIQLAATAPAGGTRGRLIIPRR